MNTQTNSSAAKKFIMYAVLLLAAIGCYSCHKNKDALPVKNTEVKATVTLSPGNIVTINATGSKAVMGSAFYGGGTFIDGTNENNAAVYISVYNSSFSPVTVPGTYNFDCQYRPDITSQSTPIYVNTGSSDPGSITFTIINDHYMEGYFNSVCVANADTVIVSGSFKGDY